VDGNGSSKFARILGNAGEGLHGLITGKAAPAGASLNVSGRRLSSLEKAPINAAEDEIA